MRVLMQTNDAVALSYAEALLRDAGVPSAILDQNMSVLEGSIGALPRRLAVSDAEEARAREILRAAGVPLLAKK